MIASDIECSEYLIWRFIKGWSLSQWSNPQMSLQKELKWRWSFNLIYKIEGNNNVRVKLFTAVVFEEDR